MKFSKRTSRLLDWDMYRLAVPAVTATAGNSSIQNGDAPDRDARLKSFERIRDDFERVLGATHSRMNQLLLFIAAGVAIAIVAGIFVATWQAWWGGVLTFVGQASLIPLFREVLGITRDQAMLRLIPAKYQLALTYCQTPECEQKLIALFLQEVTSARSDRQT